MSTNNSNISNFKTFKNDPFNTHYCELDNGLNLYLVKYQGFALDDKFIYIVTELVTGGSLFDLLRKEMKFPFPQTMNYCAQVVLMLELN